MRHPSLPMLLILLTAFNAQQAIGDSAAWYSPFLMALVVIGFAAVLQRDNSNDRT